MEADIKECPDKICRTCLCKSSNMRSLTTKIEGDHRTLLEVLVFVADLDIKSNTKLPAQVCNDCELIICKFDAFKQQCIQSESTLNQQMIIDTPEEFELEINEKPVIKKELKKELTVKKVKIGKGPHKKRSKQLKGSKSKFLKLLQTSTFKNEKDDIATLDVASSSVETNVDTLLDMKFLGKEVKIETLNDDNDLGMDFGDNEPFDSPLEFKQESAVSEVSVYSCSCGTVFNTEDEYKTHLEHKTCNGYTKSMKIKLEKRNPNGGRKITIKRRIVCPECNLEFETIKACRLHQQKHKNDDENGIFECTKCMRKFNRKSSYTTHINHHDIKANVKYTCDSCKRQFQHKAHLDNHILAVHTREKGYTCEICNTNFSTQESLDAHKDSHKIEKKHQCKLCKKAFYMLSTLNDHMRIHTGEKPFLCSICGRGFSQKTNLAQHMRRHQGLKPFKCEECDRGFVSKGELVAHTRKHSGAHPFVCDDCGSGFTTSSSLVKHRRIHTGERPYACDLCPLRFAASGTLKNHRRTHTGEKPYQCSYCEKAFVQRQDLVSHIRCHTGERPFACGCGQAFRKAASLKQHVKMHAKDQLMHMVHCEATHAASATGLG